MSIANLATRRRKHTAHRSTNFLWKAFATLTPSTATRLVVSVNKIEKRQ